MQRSTIWILIFILGLGAFLRFYKLDWGEGLYAHPDEYHIASSVSQLSFPNQMHPHFFSYGTATIYTIYFTQGFLTFLSSIFNFPLSGVEGSIFNVFLLGRFYSAFFSTLTILIVYKITTLLLTNKWGLLAALLATLTPGLIQQAHFATPESALTFFLFSSLFFVLRYEKHGNARDIFISAVLLGIALGIKITAVLILPLLGVVLLLRHWQSPRELVSFGMVAAILVIGAFMFVAPYVVLDYPAWRSTTLYEGALAMGKTSVFYTRQFIDTIPIVFQLEKILPYALGPAILVFGVLGFIIVMLNSFQHLLRVVMGSRNEFGMTIGTIASARMTMRGNILLIIAFLFLFFPNAFLFAKWTRFIVPTFPFFAIFAVLFLTQLANKARMFSYILVIILIITTTFWSLAFFSIYTRHDVRVEASKWLESNVVPASSFLIEGGNMVDLPLKGTYKKASLDFYNLESDPQVHAKIIDALVTSDYFLIQSRRVFMNHQRLPELYPKTARFYDALFTGQLGFAQVKEFSSYPQLQVTSYKLQVPDEGAEETWSVFDHPVIRVFKKEKQLTREAYSQFL